MRATSAVAPSGRVGTGVIWSGPRGVLREHLRLFSNLELTLQLHRQRRKVEEGFRDLKGLLGLGKVMNKRRENMEKMVTLPLLAYSSGLLTGERLREELYRGKREPFTQGSSSC